MDLVANHLLTKGKCQMLVFYYGPFLEVKPKLTADTSFAACWIAHHLLINRNLQK